MHKFGGKGYNLDNFGYNMLLDALAKDEKVDVAYKVLEDMKKKHCRPDEYTYTILIRMNGRLGKLNDAVTLFEKMLLKDCKPNSMAYNTMLEALGDRDAYLSMLESLCNAGKVTEAIDMLSTTHEKGIMRDTFMYNTVFSALGKSKHVAHLLDLVDEAVRIFEELENSDCRPDVVSYNSLINCLGKNGDVDEAHMRLKEMQERVEMAYSLFDEMLAEGCCPNIVTYNILLDCLEKSGRSAEAVDLYSKLKEEGLTPDSITYAILERLQSGSQRTHRIRKQNPITGAFTVDLSDNVWDLHRSLCSSAEELTNEQLEQMLPAMNKGELLDGMQAYLVAEEGLDTLPNLAIQGEVEGTVASSENKTKHLHHRQHQSCEKEQDVDPCVCSSTVNRSINEEDVLNSSYVEEPEGSANRLFSQHHRLLESDMVGNLPVKQDGVGCVNIIVC
ncbi:hypothetical protein SASPL_121291 [Salvia splendens]|uniref:Uncharacterized protein n=1 Tax=Salvia splendens TaxID=180675 RepID=A0A8X8ZVY8_SALSN|nr:hypothetical protein SASPL_121291 [Salvia splendens]